MECLSILSLWWFMCQRHTKPSNTFRMFGTAFIYKQWCLTGHNKKEKAQNTKSLTKMPILQIQHGCMTTQKYQVRVFTVGKQILLMCLTLRHRMHAKNKNILAKSTTIWAWWRGHEVLFSQGNACILQPALLKAWSSKHQSAFFIDLIEHKS